MGPDEEIKAAAAAAAAAALFILIIAAGLNRCPGPNFVTFAFQKSRRIYSIC